MTKRKVEQMIEEDGGTTPASAPVPVPATSVRSRRGAAASNTVNNTTMAASSSSSSVPVPMEDDDDEPMTSDKPTRRGGRVAAPVEIRREQKEAMQRLATAETHGVDCPSWYSFKNIEFVKKRAGAIGPGRQWKNYKQIVERENYHLKPPSTPTYSSMRSAPSSMPPRKYCDLTGFPAKYTDPKTHLHYYSSAEYAQIKDMHTETIKQMLEIRNKTPSHQLMLR